MIHDYIVVGSGATGAHAAQTLVESGARVAMLDVGVSEDRYKSLVPDMDFTTMREQDPAQHRYLLGDQFEGLPWGDIKVGAQLTPPRQFILRDTQTLIPLESESFRPMESLAYGGLGNGWGLGCFVFSGPELKRIGLDRSQMEVAYQVIQRRIGISAVKDDVAPYCIGTLEEWQEGLSIDMNCRELYAAYVRKRSRLNRLGFFLGQPPLAILTQDLGDRKRTSYHDMDFYSDHDQSAYRPWMTIDRLKRNSQFQYFNNSLVVSFADTPDHVAISVHKTDTNRKEVVKCKRLILASGVLGTARIVLRSVKGAHRLPLICNHYCYVPCIHLRRLGKPVERFKTSMAQLVLIHDEDGTNSDVAVASLFSYRSLMLFRIIKEAPLNYADARTIMQYLLPSFVIAGIHHPDSASPNKFVELVSDHKSPTRDKLRVSYSLTSEELVRTADRERKYLSALRTLRCMPLKKVYPGYGSSIHYAGTLPFSEEDAPYTLARNGRLYGTRNVFVADGSGFRFLPAKGLTFSLMANAHLVARHSLNA
jgi:hypothetical protein